jgi:hypothetical protein
MNHRFGYVNDKTQALVAGVLLYLPVSYRSFSAIDDDLNQIRHLPLIAGGELTGVVPVDDAAEPDTGEPGGRP